MEIAQAACESVYTSCDVGSCGYFDYYHGSEYGSCECYIPSGTYEFIYDNNGHDQVGQDYGGQSMDIFGSNLFVRQKTSDNCDFGSWTLVLADLGADVKGNVCNVCIMVF